MGVFFYMYQICFGYYQTRVASVKKILYQKNKWYRYAFLCPMLCILSKWSTVEVCRVKIDSFWFIIMFILAHPFWNFFKKAQLFQNSMISNHAYMLYNNKRMIHVTRIRIYHTCYNDTRQANTLYFHVISLTFKINT